MAVVRCHDPRVLECKKTDLSLPFGRIYYDVPADLKVILTVPQKFISYSTSTSNLNFLKIYPKLKTAESN